MGVVVSNRANVCFILPPFLFHIKLIVRNTDGLQFGDIDEPALQILIKHGLNERVPEAYNIFQRSREQIYGDMHAHEQAELKKLREELQTLYPKLMFGVKFERAKAVLAVFKFVLIPSNFSVSLISLAQNL